MRGGGYIYIIFWPIFHYRTIIGGVFSAWNQDVKPSVLATLSGKLVVQSSEAE